MIVSVVTSASFCMCFCRRKLDFHVSDIFAISIWCLNLLLTLANDWYKYHSKTKYKFYSDLTIACVTVFFSNQIKTKSNYFMKLYNSVDMFVMI